MVARKEGRGKRDEGESLTWSVDHRASRYKILRSGGSGIGGRRVGGQAAVTMTITLLPPRSPDTGGWTVRPSTCLELRTGELCQRAKVEVGVYNGAQKYCSDGYW